MERRKSHINPQISKWARESIHYTITAASEKLGLEEHELIAIEDGQKAPSFTLVRAMCELYKRPLSVFYLPKPPKSFMTLRDFRRIDGEEIETYSPELAILIKDTIEKAEALNEIMKDEGVSSLDYIGSYGLDDDYMQIAADIRKRLGLHREEIHPSREAALNAWIERIENIGIFVFQTGNEQYKKIRVTEARGFALADKYAPFIFLNEQDAKAARIFTLLHEVSHLWVNQSGVSNIGFRNIQMYKLDRVEQLCNKIAAEVLMPDAILKNELGRIRYSKDKPDSSVVYLSNKYKLSKSVVLRKIYDLKMITNEKYFEVLDLYRDEWEVTKKILEKRKDQDGGPSPYLMKVIHNGRAYSKYILGLYQGERITASEAVGLLGTKVNQFGKLVQKL